MKKIYITCIVMTALFSFPFCKKGSETSSRFDDTTRTYYTNKAGNARAIALDVAGNLYSTDVTRNQIFKVTPDGTASVFAGTGQLGNWDGPAASATFQAPSGIAVDSHGNVYVSDLGNGKIRKISKDGNVTTIGSAHAYYICIDKNDKLYIADYDRNVVTAMDENGTETIIAGKAYYTGYVNGPADDARFSYMRGIGVDPSGNIFVTDGSARIRRIDASTHVVSTFVGDYVNADTWHDGDPTQATFGELWGITFDAMGNMIVADYRWNRFRKVTPGRYTTTFPDIYNGPSDAKVTADGNIIAATEQDANIYLVKITR